MARITGKPSRVVFLPLPPDGELLAMEGKQIWYGTPDGLGSATTKDITAFFVPGSVGIFSSSNEGEES